CGGDFVGHFVAFEDVLEGAHLEAEFLGDAEQHKDFVFTVAMRVHVTLTLEDFDKRLEAQIAARRNQVFPAACYALVVGIPRRFVVARFSEGGTNGFLYAHARDGITHSSSDTEIGALGIFSESKFDAGQCTLERELRRGLAPAKLDHNGLSTDGVSAAVQDIRGGYAAGEVAIDGNVVGIK